MISGVFCGDGAKTFFLRFLKVLAEVVDCLLDGWLVEEFSN